MRRSFTFLSCAAVLLATTVTIGCAGGSSKLSDPPSPNASAAVVITPSAALLMPGQTIDATQKSGGSFSPSAWNVNNVAGGSAATGTITASGLYTAPATSAPSSVQITLASPSTQSPTAQISFFKSSSFKPGTVTGTGNSLVALYTFSAPQGATVQVKFGTTTNYGLTTWAQPALPEGGEIGILVAGMQSHRHISHASDCASFHRRVRYGCR